jgi:hypothetical protein
MIYAIPSYFIIGLLAAKADKSYWKGQFYTGNFDYPADRLAICLFLWPWVFACAFFDLLAKKL